MRGGNTAVDLLVIVAWVTVLAYFLASGKAYLVTPAAIERQKRPMAYWATFAFYAVVFTAVFVELAVGTGPITMLSRLMR